MWTATIALFLRLCLVGQLPLLLQQEQAAAPTTTVSVPVRDASTTQPAIPSTTQASVQVTVKTEPSNTEDNTSTIFDIFGKTRLGKLAQGKDKLNPSDVLQFQFWFDIARDTIWAILGFIPRVLVAILFLFVFWLVYRAIRRLVLGSMTKAHVDQSIRDMLGTLIKWGVMGFGLVIACNQVGIQITALLTGVSIIGLAIGFAAQETLANFIAGVVIFWDKPFKVGDWVTVDGNFSQVQRVTFRSTRLLTLDGQIIVFPNTYMLANKVLNHSAHPINRINIPIGISYSASIDDARSVLLALTTHDPRLCNDPPPQVVVNQCGDSSVNLILRFWIRDESQEQAIFVEYLEKVKKALDKAGIEIPFPHMQVLLEKTEAIDVPAGKAA